MSAVIWVCSTCETPSSRRGEEGQYGPFRSENHAEDELAERGWQRHGNSNHFDLIVGSERVFDARIEDCREMRSIENLPRRGRVASRSSRKILRRGFSVL